MSYFNNGGLDPSDSLIRVNVYIHKTYRIGEAYENK